MAEITRLLMLIDSEPAQSRLITAVAAREGWRTLVVGNAPEAISALDEADGRSVSAIILDQSVPGESACDLIASLKQKRPDAPVLMLTASASPLLAVEAMRSGANDYLIKPIAPERLMQALRAATEREAPKQELQPLAEKLQGTLDFDSMIGTSPSFRSALAQAAKAARGNGSVLIEGESGTGKEMLLRAMHGASPRAKAPLRIVNIGTSSGSAVESLLFGHEPNAFPGAFDRQVGAIQHADTGTVVLDDVDRLEPQVQENLLAMIESGIVRPVGAEHGFRVDVRFMATSNLPLEDMVSEGHFRPELLKAIGATRIVLPPLRERSGDIAPLTRHFLARIGEEPGLRHLSITDSALSLLAAFDWPGNVRQLQAVLFRAAVFCDAEALTPESFPDLNEMLGDREDTGEAKQSHDGMGVLLYQDDGNLRPLEEIEADVIRLAIGHYRGRMTEVARRLGIGRSTLYRKLSDLGIDNAA
ncbi:sigma-54-dependent transcriptional regulator [Altererythrobacter sp. MF3-039]|uniref:sigma-54-dependent transcriptional regulator n=1 Tax=Altererythrobacter sp. MF3-039 TaxID=3252901 RepID=UPI00390CB948